MKNFFSFLFVSIFSASLISSCYYDKEQLLYGTGVCKDTITTVSYSKDIVPILQQNCYNCHSGNFPSGNVTLGTYAADKAVAQKGSLYGSINHTAGYVPMPQGGTRLGSCQIARIKIWIEGGLLNN